MLSRTNELDTLMDLSIYLCNDVIIYSSDFRAIVVLLFDCTHMLLLGLVLHCTVSG